MRPELLVVESDAVLAEQYRHELGQNFNVVLKPSAQAALDALSQDGILPIAIVTDVLLGEHDGVELLHELRSYDDWLAIPVIVLSMMPPYRAPRIDLSRYNVIASLYKPHCPPHKLSRQLSQLLLPGEQYS